MRYQRTFCFAALAALCASLALAAPAAAQAPAAAPEATNAQADELTHRGVDLIKKHQWAEAEALLRQAWALKHAYDIAGNLGLAEAGLGRWRAASDHLAFALETFPANGKAAHRELLREKLVKVREELGALTIVVGTVGAEVMVDGESVGTAPLAEPVFVEAGAHTVEARLAGYVTARQEVDAVKGAQTVTLAMVAVAREAPVPQSNPPRRSIVPGVALGGVAGAALVTGIVVELVASSKLSTVKSLNGSILGEHHVCLAGATNYDTRCPQITTMANSSDALHDAGIGVLIGAGAAAAAAVAYAFWPAPPPGRPTGLRAAPLLSAAGAGVIVSGTF